MPSKEQMVECMDFIDLLYRDFFNDRSQRLPTFIKWGVMAPWSFILKQLKCPFIPGLFPYGAANAKKTTEGKIALSIYGFYAINNMDGIPFDMANTPARLGEIVSNSTYSILINEVGALGTDPRLHNLVELLKTLSENIQARGGFFNVMSGENGRRSMALVPALSNLILTGNPPPPSDTGFNRRYTPIPYSTTDQLDPSNPVHARQMEKFTNIFNDNRHKLKYMGNWIVHYILNQNPDLLLKINKPIVEGGSSGNWHNAAKTVIKEFYKAAGGGEQLPTWMDLYVTIDQIAQSKEDSISMLRTFLIETVNNLYTKHLKTYEGPDTTTDFEGTNYNATRHQVMADRDLAQRLEWLLDHQLVPYIKVIKVTNNDKTILIYRHILEELKRYCGTNNSNTPTMQDIQSYLGFKYTQVRIDNGRPHVISGSLQKLKNFVSPEVKELEVQQIFNLKPTDTT
jgi:hypothetical protein